MNEIIISFHQNFEISKLSTLNCEINPYKTKDGKLALIFSFINASKVIEILMYQINISEDQISVEIIKQNTQKVLNKEVNKLQEALSKGITC